MTMMIRMVVVSILSSFELHGDDRTAGIMMWQAYFVAYRVKYATAQHVADAQICERVTVELLCA
jgi:hypothetical protein